MGAFEASKYHPDQAVSETRFRSRLFIERLNSPYSTTVCCTAADLSGRTFRFTHHTGHRNSASACLADEGHYQIVAASFETSYFPPTRPLFFAVYGVGFDELIRLGLLAMAITFPYWSKQIRDLYERVKLLCSSWTPVPSFLPLPYPFCKSLVAFVRGDGSGRRLINESTWMSSSSLLFDFSTPFFWPFANFQHVHRCDDLS